MAATAPPLSSVWSTSIHVYLVGPLLRHESWTPRCPVVPTLDPCPALPHHLDAAPALPVHTNHFCSLLACVDAHAPSACFVVSTDPCSLAHAECLHHSVPCCSAAPPRALLWAIHRALLPFRTVSGAVLLAVSSACCPAL